MSLIDRTDERRCFVDCGQPNCPCKTRITKADLEYAIKVAFGTPIKTERKVDAITGCIENGWIPVDKFCDNPDCKNCRERQANFLRLMQEEVQKQINDLENGK